MKRITFLAVALFMVLSIQAQNTSFEAEEGYELGEILGQQTWAMSQYSDQATSPMFTISDEMASDGEYSFKLGLDEDEILSAGYKSGVIWDLSDELPETPDTYEISFDLYISDPGEGGHGFDFYVFDEEGFNTTVVLFFGEKLLLMENVNGVLAPTVEEQVPFDVFNNLKIQYNFEEGTILYYLNDELFNSGDIVLGETIGSLGFYTEGTTEYYIDNFISGQPSNMGIDKTNEPFSFQHYTQDQKLYIAGESLIEKVEVYSILGQELVSKEINATSATIDLEGFSGKFFIAHIYGADHSQSFKFMMK